MYNIPATNRLIPEKMASHHPVVALFSEINTREVFMGTDSKICEVFGCTKNAKRRYKICCMHKYRWDKFKSYDIPKSRSERFLDTIKELPENIVKICKSHGNLTINNVYKHKNKRAMRGFVYICKQCRTEQNWNKDCKKHGKLEITQRMSDGRCALCRNEKELQQKIRRKFKLNKASYEQMVLDQNNKCAICNQEQKITKKDGSKYPLYLDHCHVTGKIRQLLCTTCNMGLGAFYDKIELMKKAADYILFWREQHGLY